MAVTMSVYYRDGLKRNGPMNDARFFRVLYNPERVTRLDADGFGNNYFVYVSFDRGAIRVTAPDNRYSETSVENGEHYEVWV
jgi:hypothetical protein